MSVKSVEAMFRSMSRYLLRLVPAVAGVMILSVSCARSDVPEREPQKVKVWFVVSSETKALVSAYEENVASVDILVFRQGDGTLDAAEHFSGSGPFSLTVSGDMPLRWYAVANAPSGVFGSVVRESDFLSLRTGLSDSTLNTLVMGDAGSVTVTSSSGLDVEVYLKRYVSKVYVKNVTFKYYDSFSSGPVVTLERVAVINAAGDIPYGGTPGPETWYNKMSVDASLPSPVGGMLVTDYGHKAISSSVKENISAELYAMPNPVANGVNSENTPLWSERTTRVALEFSINGVTNWYPVDLPAMQSNRCYTIENITILGPGSASPDIPVSRTDVDFDIVINPWTSDSHSVYFPS